MKHIKTLEGKILLNGFNIPLLQAHKASFVQSEKF